MPTVFTAPPLAKMLPKVERSKGKAENASPVVEGRREAVKDFVKERETQRHKFHELVQDVRTPLYKLSSVFPFDLFPNKIIIDVHKINVIFKEFFWSGRTLSIYIQNISDVLIDKSLFFATLKIVDKGYVENMVRVSYLWKKEADRARSIIQGLVIADKEGIDLTKIENKEIMMQVEKLGETHESEP